jgi:hypothetical protein
MFQVADSISVWERAVTPQAEEPVFVTDAPKRTLYVLVPLAVALVRTL